MDLFYNIFQLPEGCVFHTEIPKNTFAKKNKLSATEKKLIDVPFLPLKSIFKASLGQSRSFILPYHSQEMDYEDIVFCHLMLKSEHLPQYAEKLTLLYQKYIPKPCVILLQADSEFIINTALKKYNEVENNKRIVLENISTPILDITNLSQIENLKSFRYQHINKQNLMTAHQSYAKAIADYKVYEVTGNFGRVDNVKTPIETLRKIKEIEKELDALRNAIKKTKDINEKVQKKLLFKEKNSKLQQLKESL